MNQPPEQPLVDPREGMTSASAAEADRLCPGRFLAQRGLPEAPSALSGRGDRIHAALAAQTPDGLSVEEQGVYQDCQRMELAMAEEMFGAELPQSKLFREQRYWVRLQENRSHSGQADLVRRLGPRAIIVDYKTGFLEVAESPTNEQLRDLAVLVRGGLPGVTDIAVAIIQPTISKKPSVCLYTSPDIDRAEREMFARILASHNPLSPRVAGEVQCNKHYCRAKLACVEYQKFAATMLPAETIEAPRAQGDPVEVALAMAAAGR